MIRAMRDLVQVQGDFKPSVQLPADFYDEKHNEHFVRSYIPTHDTLEIFRDLQKSLQPNSDRRARLLTGTFGTGKSDLMLMIANYVTRKPDDPLMAPFFERLRGLDNATADALYNARFDKPGFLLVLLQADTAVTFSGFILDGLAHALESAGLGHLMGETYYDAALELIRSWETDIPDNIARLQQVLELNHNTSVRELKQELASPRADVALDIFRASVQAAIGMPFAPTHVIERPFKAFMDVAKQLVAEKRYSGIFIIADEFTHLLKKLGESNTAADSKAIDNLAEAATRSGLDQIHFYVVSLESFAGAYGNTTTSQVSLERSGGRFLPTEIRSQDTEELISSSLLKKIQKDSLFAGAQDQEDDLLNLAIRLWGGRVTGRVDKARLKDTVVRGCFPLHPLATFCLPRLNEELAQNARTMFQFIWDREKGLDRFIKTVTWDPDAGEVVPVMSLDGLFSYFEPTLKEKRLDLLHAYDQARALLSTEQIAVGLEGRLLRALVMLEVASGDPGLQADAELLRHAVGLPRSRSSEVTAALKNLEDANVAYPSLGGYYQLVRAGRANPGELRRLVEQAAQGQASSSIEMLNTFFKPNDVDAERYNKERGSWRTLTSLFIDTAGLQSPATVNHDLAGKDGLLYYVIASSDQELAQAKTAALLLTRQNEQIVVAVLREPTDLVRRFRRLRALQDLQKHPDYQSQDYKGLLSNTGLVGGDYVSAFEEARQVFNRPSKLEWYRRGQAASVSTPEHLNLLASAVMKEVFPSTPQHGIPQHLTPSGKKKAVEDAIEKLLQAPFPVASAAKRKKSGDEAVLLDGAERLGLIYKSGQDTGLTLYDIQIPGKQQTQSREIWDLLDERLDKKIEWAEIISELMRRPYGLYPSVLQLFIAAFYRLNRDFIEVYAQNNLGGQPVTVYDTTVIEMVEQPGKYKIRYHRITDQQRTFLRGIAERVLFPGRQFAVAVGENASLRTRVAKLMRQWINTVPTAARNATSEEFARMLLSHSSETDPARSTLIEAASMPTEAQTAAALLADLPEQVGLPSEGTEWTDESVGQALAYLEAACQEIRQFPSSFKGHIAFEVGKLFGLEERSSDWNVSLGVARSWRASVAHMRGLHFGDTPDARDLLQVLDDNPYSFEQVFLHALPSRWGYKAIEEWQEIATGNLYLHRLRTAKAAVDAKAASVERPETKTTQNPQPQPSVVPGPRPSVAPLPGGAAVVQKPPPSVPATSGNGAGTNTGVQTIAPAQQPGGVDVAVEGKEPAAPAPKPVDEAFSIVVRLIEGLSQQDQYELWERLVEKYDPR